MKSSISVLVGLLYIAGFVPYIVAIVRQQAKPAKATWIVWASLDTVALVGMIAKHSANVQILAATAGAWIVALLALRLGTSGWKRLDKVCLSVAVLAIALWKIFDSPTVGLVTSLSAMLLASFPTFLSAWDDSRRENKMAWTLFWLSCVAAFIAVPAWTLENVAQPMTFFIIETVMMVLIFIRPHFMHRTHS